MISAIKRTVDTVRIHGMAIGSAVREDYRNTAAEKGRLRAGYDATGLALTGAATALYIVGLEGVMGSAATSGYLAAEAARPGSGIIGAIIGGTAVSATAEFGLSEVIPPVLAKAPRTAEVIEAQKYGTTDQPAVATVANGAAMSILAGSPGNIIHSYARNPTAPPAVHKRVGRKTAAPLTALNAGICGAYGTALAIMPGKTMATVIEYAQKPHFWLGLSLGLFAVGKTATLVHKSRQSKDPKHEHQHQQPETHYDPWARADNTIGEPLLPTADEPPELTPLAQAFAASDERKAAQAAQRTAAAQAVIAKKHADTAALESEQWLDPTRLTAYLEAQPTHQSQEAEAIRERTPLQPHARTFLRRVYGQSDVLPTLHQQDVSSLADDLLDSYYHNLDREADRKENPKIDTTERHEFRRALQQHLGGMHPETIARRSTHWTTGTDVECALLHMTASLRAWDNRLYSNEGQKEEYQYPPNMRLRAPSETLQRYYQGQPA
jgi:hypothetical protein